MPNILSKKVQPPPNPKNNETSLLPSERLALTSNSPKSSPTKTYTILPTTTTTTPSSPSTNLTPIKKKSRNDLFELDWSPVTPNVNSFTPPPVSIISTPSPYNNNNNQSFNSNGEKSNWIEQSRNQPAIQVVLPPTPPSHSTSSPLSKEVNGMTTNKLSASELNGENLPLSPTSPQFASFGMRGNSIDNVDELNSVGRVGEISIASSSNPILDSRQSPRLRLVPTTEYILGEGRHASVYLASYVPTPSSSSTTPVTSTSSHCLPESNWRLCAAKRVLPDRESQVAGLGEAFILSRLAVSSNSNSNSNSSSNKNIIGLIGVKDERDGIEPVASTSRLPSNASSHSTHIRSTSSNYTNSRSASKRHATFNTRDILPPPIGSPSLDSNSNLLPFPIENLSSPSSPSSQTLTSSPPLSTVPVSSIPKEFKRKERGPRYSEPFSIQTLEKKKSSLGLSISPNDNEGGIKNGSLGRSKSIQKNDFINPTTTTGITRRSSGSQFQYQSQRSSHPIHSSTTSPTSTSNSTTTTIIDSPPPRIILMLEYCPFGTVSSFLKSWPERVGKKRWLEWAKELVGAVYWSHEKGILHADLKPQNVLVAQDLSLRLSDFGLSTFISPDPSLAPLDPIGLGTPPYSPPEFVHPPPSPFSFPSDIFSLGVTLSVMITGREPYEGLRGVERMFLVSRGGYYEWEERRRLGVIGLEDSSFFNGGAGGAGGSNNVSRNNSLKSINGSSRRINNRSSLTSNGNGNGTVNELGIVNNILSNSLNSNNNSNSSNGGVGGLGRMRSDSMESSRSFFSSTGATGTGSRIGGGGGDEEWQRGSWGTAVLAKRLLKMDLLEEEVTTSEEEVEEEEATEETVEIEVPSPETLLSFLPPPSPITSEFDSQDEEEEQDEDIPMRRSSNAYPAGTPYQYFLNGLDVVPLEVRELLRMMTSPKIGDRPTAQQVLKTLESWDF